MKLLIRYPLILLVLLFGATGCVSIVRPEQSDQTEFAILDKNQSIGQTFISRFDGLDAVVLNLNLEDIPVGTLTLSIADGENKDTVISTTTFPLDQSSSGGEYQLAFPPIKESTNKFFYANLLFEGNGQVFVGKSHGSTYLNGSSYVNNVPEDFQLNFKLSYYLTDLLWGILQEFLYWICLIFLAFILFIIPGCGILCVFWPNSIRLHWFEKLALSAGISLAVYPILIFWTYVLGLNLGRIYAWLPPAIGLILILWNNRNRILERNFSKPNLVSKIGFADITLAVISSLIFIVRFWVIRNLSIPLWGDSYQHTMVTQLIIDNNGLFNSWLPYVPLSSFTYHFGFHSLVSAFHWITQKPPAESLLWIGQIVNGIAVIAVFPLAYRIGKSVWAGTAAILISGLLTGIPMFFINWGRYTQLAGLTILPVVVFILHRLFRQEKLNLKLIIISTIGLIGLALTHMHVFIFALIYIAVELLLSFPESHIAKKIQNAIIVVIGTFILTLPWLSNLLNFDITKILIIQVSSVPKKIETQILLPEMELISSFIPEFLFILTPVVIGWGFWKRSRGIFLICLWWLLIILASNPNWLSLPGLGVINNFSTVTSLYIPIGIMLGCGFGWFVVLLGKQTDKLMIHGRWLEILVSMALVLMSVWGVAQRRNDIEVGDYTLAARPDENAARWITKNTEKDARFLVNSMFAFDDFAVVGTDGGWWLPLLADRDTTQPPVPYIIEDSYIPDYRELVNGLIDEITQKGIDHPDILDQLHKRKITHIYLGQQQGLVNSLSPMLTPADLLSNTHFELVYHQDRVWIFKVLIEGLS